MKASKKRALRWEIMYEAWMALKHRYTMEELAEAMDSVDLSTFWRAVERVKDLRNREVVENSGIDKGV